MDLLGAFRGLRIRAGFEDEGERVLARGGGAPPHFGVEVEAGGGVGAGGVSSDQSVPDESVGRGDVGEQFEGVGEVAGIGESGEVD